MTPPRDLEASLREHGTGLHQLACALVGRAEADDAVQEVWLEALRAPPSREGPLGGWLRTVLNCSTPSRRALAHRGMTSTDCVSV